MDRHQWRILLDSRRPARTHRSGQWLDLSHSWRAFVSMYLIYGVVFLVALALWVLSKVVTVVPQQSAYVIEHLGKYSRTLSAGFHVLTPFMERIAYKHSLKEIAIDIAEQICITRDNVQVGVDGVLYMQVMDPH